jgi:hypothetical protein
MTRAFHRQVYNILSYYIYIYIVTLYIYIVSFTDFLPY